MENWSKATFIAVFLFNHLAPMNLNVAPFVLFLRKRFARTSMIIQPKMPAAVNNTKSMKLGCDMAQSVCHALFYEL